jgi:hypothetical protein
MAARSGLMKDHRWFSMDKLVHSLPVRILLVVLLSLAFSALVPMLFLYNRAILPAVLKWTSLAAVGVYAGLASRLLLGERTVLLRFLASLLALLSCLIFLGLLYPGDVGARLPDQHQSGLNLAWLGQFALGSLLAFVTLQAWKVRLKPAGRKKKSASDRKRSASSGSRKPRTKSSTRRSHATPESRSEPASRATPASRVTPASRAIPADHTLQSVQPRARSLPVSTPSRAIPSLAERLHWEKRWSGLNKRLHEWWEHGLRQPAGATSHSARRPLVRLPHKHRPVAVPPPQPDSPVRLVGEEEHRCPYCLELVQKNDPRGITVCPICHTQHHADCWALTGVCQVPHYHE